jgi:PD-(D/E)XK nuclease superfamily
VAVVTLDLSFLAVPLRPMPAPSRPVNVYDILGEAWRETRVDMTLQFFLDPNERHGLGTLVMDALLRLLDGAPMIGPEGKTDTLFAPEDYERSDAWEIGAQVGYIDVYATNRDRGIAVVLENKLGHKLDNPLDRYAAHALGDQEITAVLVVVLAPEHRVAIEEHENWLSRSITYAELADEIKRSQELVHTLLDPVDRDQWRSLDLLQQFIEARSGDTDVNDLSREAVRLDE